MDLELIQKIKKLREDHDCDTSGNHAAGICLKCSANGKSRLVEYPCDTLKAFDALIRVADLARFMASPINIGLDVDQAAKEIELAIKYETNYNAAPIFGGAQ